MKSAQRNTVGLFFLRAFQCALVFLFSCRAYAQIQPSYGDSLLVDEITFSGNIYFDGVTLLERISTKESPGSVARFLYNISERIPFSAEPQYFDYDAFTRDLDQIRQFYKNNGFFSAQVEGKYLWVNDSTAISVNFTVDEGLQSYIDSVYYKNINKLPHEVRDEIFNDPLLLPGRRYRADDVQAEINRIGRIMNNNGFPRAYSDSVIVERKMSNNNVLIRLPFYFGKRLSFGRITESIVGVDELNLARKIIYDRLDFREGDIYSTEKRERAETNLNRLGVFAGVQIVPVFPSIEDTVNTSAPMTLILAQKDRHELAPGVLANYQFNRLNAGAEIAYLFRNVFGGAQTLTSKVTFVGKVPEAVKAYQATAQIRFDQPYVIDNYTSAYWAISYILAKEEGLYSGNITQNVIGFQRRLTNRLHGFFDWTLEQSKYGEISKSLTTSPFAFFDTTGIDYRNSILSVALERDFTNDFFNPTAGNYVKLIVEEAGLFKQIIPGLFAGFQSTEYRKVEGLFKLFTDLSRNQSGILGLKLKIGGIFRYGESKSNNIPVPFNRRYYAGGSTSIRGWGTRKLAVNGVEMANFGSNALLESSMEYRWQLFPYTEGFENFWFVFFADAGNLWSELGSIRIRETAIAFGFGLRYNFFFGPIRVDFGMKAYDPSLPHHRWFFERKFWSEVFTKGIPYLGIGHAF